MKLLESLVADKEALRKSNIELQDLLSESREALQALQEEADERLASRQEAGTFFYLLSYSPDFPITLHRSDDNSLALCTVP
jgi:hypothetical protein